LLIIVLLQLPFISAGRGIDVVDPHQWVGLFNRHRRGMSGARIRDRVIINGAHGEGGGQILRAALSLSAITGGRFASSVSALPAGAQASPPSI
jgi:hypothetical protein